MHFEREEWITHALESCQIRQCSLTCYEDRAAFGQVHIRPGLLAACGFSPPPPIRRAPWRGARAPVLGGIEVVFCGMVVGKHEIARPRLACLRWRTIEVVHRAVVGVVPVGREERHGTASQQEAQEQGAVRRWTPARRRRQIRWRARWGCPISPPHYWRRCDLGCTGRAKRAGHSHSVALSPPPLRPTDTLLALTGTTSWSLALKDFSFK